MHMPYIIVLISVGTLKNKNNNNQNKKLSNKATYIPASIYYNKVQCIKTIWVFWAEVIV